MKKYFIFIFVLLFSFCTNTYASTNVVDRNTLKNYGVNKDWELNDSNMDNVLNTPKVDASEKIYDFSDILTDEEESLLKVKIDEFINKYNTDLVIVTNSFGYYNDNENEEYAADFYDYNDFGMDYPNNSGILFFRNSVSSDPYYDIYTFGDAQLYFNQYRYDKLLDGIYSDIKMQNYEDGMSSMIDYINEFYISGIPNDMKNYKVDDKGYLYKIYRVPWIIALLVSTVLTTIVISILIKKNKMVRKKEKAASYLKRNSVNINIEDDKFISTHTSHYTVSSSSSGGGGHSSSSGSSGGGHSSGGGRHG